MRVPGRFRTVLALGLLLLLAAAPALARSWRVANWHSIISVQQDGTALVTEQVTFAFVGQFQGIHRYIPIEYPGPAGSNYTLFMKVVGVKDNDNNGRPLKYELGKRGDSRDIKVYIPGAADTTRSIEIVYQVQNGTRFFADHDEFYWNVTGTEWPVPIDHASAYVIFPDKAAGSLRAQAFTGVYGSKQSEATSEVKGNKVEFETTNPLPMRGGLTIDVYLPKGILQQPNVVARALWFARSNPIVFLPLISFAVMFALWYSKGRDPDAGMSVAPMYEPPAKLSPAEVGTLVDDTVDPRDITSTLLDMAVKGYIQIQELETQGLLFKHRDYLLVLKKPIGEWEQLLPHERAMLAKIFGAGGQQTRLSDLKENFYTVIPMIKQDILRELKDKGMYALDPEKATLIWFLGIVVIVGIVVLLQWSGLVQFFLSGVAGVVAIVVSIAIVFLFGRQMTAKSLLGVRTYVGVRGFQEFMTRVDADRISRMPMDTFEKFLPYAMALGVENRWAKAFEGILKQPPQWYVPAHGGMPMHWNTMMFANSMRSLTSEAHQAFVSAPRASSSGSGFGGGGFSSGGGFSGGGFGGGGGGAF